MILTKQKAIEYINSLQDEIILDIKEYKSNRSNNQNSLYWAYITDLKQTFEEKGIFITVDDLHEWLKTKLIKWTYKKNSITWQRILKRKSTTKLNKKEFSSYMKDIELYLIQEFEISVPLMTDVFYKDFNF